MSERKLVDRRRVGRVDFSKYRKAFGDCDGRSAGREILRRLRIAANLENLEQSGEIKERNIRLLDDLLNNPTGGESEGMMEGFKVYPGESYTVQYMRRRDLLDLSGRCSEDVPLDARINDSDAVKHGGFFYDGMMFMKIDLRGSLEKILADFGKLLRSARDEFGVDVDGISSEESLKSELRIIERVLAEYDRHLLKERGFVAQTQEHLAMQVYPGQKAESARTSLRDTYKKYCPLIMRDDYAFRLQFRCLLPGVGGLG